MHAVPSVAGPPGSRPTRASRLFAWYVALARRRAGLIAAILGAIAVAALTQAVRLGLNTDMAELLPSEHPGVAAYRRLSGRQKTSTNLVVLFSSTDQATTRRFAQALEPALATLVPGVFSDIQWRPDTQIPDYARRWRWLYADLADLESADSLLDRLVANRSGMIEDLEGDPEQDLKALRERLNKKLPAGAGGGDAAGGGGGGGGGGEPGFEMARDGRHYAGVALFRRGGGFASLGDTDALRETQRVVDQLQPASFGGQLSVEYTGQIAMALDEAAAVRDDLTLATTVCFSLVLLSIYLYFGRIGVLWVIGSPAVMGLLLALALARHTIHDLNANTAFLLSIILGNGINAPIIVLARFAEERRRGRGVDEALAVALPSTLLATGAAMLAAGVAYASLLVTSLRGFNQFGLVGGAGMLAVWICTFLLVPPLVFIAERVRPGSLTPKKPSVIWRRPFEWIGKLVIRYPRAPAIVAIGLLALSAVPLRKWLPDPYEWDFSKLRTSDSTAAKRWERMHHIGIGKFISSYIATDGIILVDQPDQAEAVAEALRKQDEPLGKKNLIREVRTLASVLPKQQPEKLELLERLRRKIDRHRPKMSDEESKEAAEWRPPEYLRTVTPDDLPRRILDGFTEVDGTRGRMVGIDAEFTHFVESDGHDLLRLSKALEVDALGKHWVAASPATVFAGMIDVILRDGPRVTLIAFVGVALLVLLAFGWGAIPVMLSLAIGLVWLGAIMAMADMRLNFLNFVALPITLGAATDYAANIWARLRREGIDKMQTVIVETGSAVALCSTTTVIGYSSLLLAHNGALRSFGLVADIGEITCLAAALLVLPAIALLRRPTQEAGEVRKAA